VRNTFDVKEGHVTLVRNVLRGSASVSHEMPQLYRYDPIKDESKEVPLSDVKESKVSADALSPDGYQIRTGDSYNGGLFPEIFFGGSSYHDYNAISLEGHGAVKGIRIDRPANASVYNFHFVGWILP
jgi:hypothetical protein